MSSAVGSHSNSNNSQTAAVAPPLGSFASLPAELRKYVYLELQSLEERKKPRFERDCANKIMHKLPRDTLNFVLANKCFAGELIDCCYKDYEWRAVIIIRHIFDGGWKIKEPAKTWLRVLRNGSSHFNFDNCIEKVRFSILYDFAPEQLQKARRHFPDIGDEWRIFASLCIQLGDVQSPNVVVAKCNITHDSLGYGDRQDSLQAHLDREVHIKVSGMINNKMSPDLQAPHPGLTVGEWRTLADFAVATIVNWFYNVKEGWGPLV